MWDGDLPSKAVQSTWSVASPAGGGQRANGPSDAAFDFGEPAAHVRKVAFETPKRSGLKQ